MPPQPSSKQSFGLAKEAVKGVSEATPAAFLPIRTVQGAREKTKLADMSLRGSAVDAYSEADGVYHGTIHAEGDVFADSFGHLLLGIFGEEALAGAGPYTHAFTVLNTGDQQPPSYTYWDNYAVTARRYPGGQVTALNITWEDGGLVAYTADAMTLGDGSLTGPTPSYGTLAPHPAWASSCLIGGATAYPLSGAMNITRQAEAIHVQDASQSARHIWLGAMTIEGTVTLLMETDVFYQQYLDNTQPTLDFVFATGAGATATGLRLLMSKATWREPTIDRSASYVKLQLGYKALGNTTDAGVSGGSSPAKVTLTNARSTVF